MSTEFQPEKRESITGTWSGVPDADDRVLLRVQHSSPFYYLTVTTGQGHGVRVACGYRNAGITDHDCFEPEPGVDPRQLAAEILTAFRKRAAEHWERTMAAGKPSAWR